MPKEQTLQGFLDNGALLIQARPTTTRLTLKYKVPKQTEGNTNATAILVAKAYDPVGGVCLKYETNRSVEVGRLMLGFQELGQLMQNVPRTTNEKESLEEVGKGEAMVIDEAGTVAQGKAETQVKQEPSAVPTTPQTSGGKKKKKPKR